MSGVAAIPAGVLASFGAWRVLKTGQGLPVAKGAVIGIHLSDTDLVMTTGDSEVGRWPFDAIVMEVWGGTTDGSLQLGATRTKLELQSVDGRSLRELRTAVSQGPPFTATPAPATTPAPAKSEDLSEPVITRSYHGSPEAIESQRKGDAAVLAAKGYYPKAQNFVPGSWGGGAWILAVALILFFGLGLLILIYLVAVKPPGTLSVIYERTQWHSAGPNEADATIEREQTARGVAPMSVTPTSAGSGADHSLVARLTQLDEARKAGLITDQEHAAGRAKVLDEM